MFLGNYYDLRLLDGVAIGVFGRRTYDSCQILNYYCSTHYGHNPDYSTKFGLIEPMNLESSMWTIGPSSELTSIANHSLSFADSHYDYFR